MKRLLMLAAVIALAACTKPAAEADANMALPEANLADANMSDANMADTNMGATAMASINGTSWEFKGSKGEAMTESVDADGKYITNANGKHSDHGTAVMKGGKVCFTSAMTKDGEMCWTNPNVAAGASAETTSDKGEKVTVKRVAYAPLTM